MRTTFLSILHIHNKATWKPNYPSPNSNQYAQVGKLFIFIRFLSCPFYKYSDIIEQPLESNLSQQKSLSSPNLTIESFSSDQQKVYSEDLR